MVRPGIRTEIPTSPSQAPWLSQALPSVVARMGAVPLAMAGPGSAERPKLEKGKGQIKGNW